MRSIVTKRRPSSSPAWRTWTTFGWRIETAARDSRTNRSRKRSSLASSGEMTFNATT